MYEWAITKVINGKQVLYSEASEYKTYPEHSKEIRTILCKT